MTVKELVSVISVDKVVKIVGEDVGAYGFVRESVWDILFNNHVWRKREVLNVDVTGAENEITITVNGEV